MAFFSLIYGNPAFSDAILILYTLSGLTITTGRRRPSTLSALSTLFCMQSTHVCAVLNDYAQRMSERDSLYLPNARSMLGQRRKWLNI